MAARSQARNAAQRRRIARKTQSVTRRRPAARPGMLATIEAHPLVTLGLVLFAGATIAAAVARPDPRRLVQSLRPLTDPLLAAATPAPRPWWEALLPGSHRTWRDDVADQAMARWHETRAAIPSRRWWEDQLDQLRGAIFKYLPQT